MGGSSMSAITDDARGALPCPFCGLTDLHVEGDSSEGFWGVECDNENCEASGPRGFESPEAAVAGWNKRASSMGNGGMNKTKTHPDNLMQMLVALAKEHGYGITQLELLGMEPFGGTALPRHSYQFTSHHARASAGDTSIFHWDTSQEDGE
jgi:hypothetical protein